MGEEFISNYYDRMEPFDQLTILDLETNDKMDLPDGNKWYVMIDKLACDDKGNYFVCDYKTNSKMKDQKEADEDRQLALYSIWVKERFKDAKSVKLLWHMLAFDKDVISERTDKQLKELQQKVVDKIKEIESAKEFPRKINVLCDYCDYRDICPSFKHQVELNRLKTVKEFKKDEGLQLVDKYSEIKTKLSELKKGEEESKDNLIQYSKQFDIDIVYGSNKKCSVKEQDKIELPEDKDKDELIKLMKEKGVWDEFSMINHMRLNGMVLRGELDTEIRDKIGLKKDFRLSLSKRKDVKED
jgi:CRISPR/Cas system-associated exonuclease Cas4 (RecB family)